MAVVLALSILSAAPAIASDGWFTFYRAAMKAQEEGDHAAALPLLERAWKDAVHAEHKQQIAVQAARSAAQLGKAAQMRTWRERAGAMLEPELLAELEQLAQSSRQAIRRSNRQRKAMLEVAPPGQPVHVLLDDVVLQGAGPWEVRPGRRRVEVRPQDQRYRSHVQWIEARRGDTRVVQAEILPRIGALHVRTDPPGGVLWVDGQFQTSEPAQVEQLLVGMHLVEAAPRGAAQWDSRSRTSLHVQIEEGEVADVTLRLPAGTEPVAQAGTAQRLAPARKRRLDGPAFPGPRGVVAQPEATAGPESDSQSWLLWSSLTAAGTGMLLAGSGALTSWSAEKGAQKASTPGELLRQNERMSMGNVLQVGGLTLIGAGAAALAFDWWWPARTGERADTGELTVLPGADGIQLELGLSWEL